jgi:hypothetical protein
MLRSEAENPSYQKADVAFKLLIAQVLQKYSGHTWRCQPSPILGLLVLSPVSPIRGKQFAYPASHGANWLPAYLNAL